MSKMLVLVDGSSYFYRAFHALPPLTNSKGNPTGAVFGVTNMIKRLLKDYDPKHIAIVFDAKGKTFRHELYDAYKANRPSMPEELRGQLEPLKSLLKAMGLPIISVPGVEADDVIGTLAIQAAKDNYKVIISTGDKDLTQLVNHNITLINTMSNTTYDIAGVEKKFGVKPELMIDYLSLIGDSSDNIPGINKCGPKTAQKWLHTYHSLDGVIKHADEVSGKVGENLRESLKQLPLSRELITIKTDVTLDVSINDLSLGQENLSDMQALLQTLEFQSWLKELQGSQNISASATSKDDAFEYSIIRTQPQFDAFLADLNKCDIFCFDTETTSLDAINAKLVGMSFASTHFRPVYIPLAHSEKSPQLAMDKVLKALKPYFESSSIQKIGQNLKYDINVLANYQIQLQGQLFDTMLESYILNSTAVRHDMDSLALKYLGYKTTSFKDIAGTGKKQKTFNDIAIEDAAFYAAEDAYITLSLHELLYPKMDASLQQVFHDIEMPLVSILAQIERHGVFIDSEFLKSLSKTLKERIQNLETQAFELAGKSFNLSSPKQLQEILYEEQKIPVISKTPTGQPSTAESVLQTLAHDYKLAEIILQHRGLTKLVSTYTDALPKRIDTHTLRIHTSYNQAIAATGRLSSSDPNLQNIPIRREEGRLIRKAFIAPKDHYLIAADYSQIELRIMAHLSQDKGLLHAFNEEIDVHSATASEIFDTPLTDVTAEQRRQAKAVNFGLIYGMSAYGLAEQLNISRDEAQHFIDVYFKRYPGVSQYMNDTRKLAHKQGFVETVFGRRLYLSDIHASNKMRQKAAERMAINAPMQGTAADIIKKAMIDIHQWQNGSPSVICNMIMQVHDELVFEIHQKDVEQAVINIKSLMINAVNLSVPMLVSIKSGFNWDEAH